MSEEKHSNGALEANTNSQSLLLMHIFPAQILCKSHEQNHSCKTFLFICSTDNYNI